MHLCICVHVCVHEDACVQVHMHACEGVYGGPWATSGVILWNPVHLLGDRVLYWPET